MASKSQWDQIERQHGILSCKYYLDDLKTIYQDYIPKYEILNLLIFAD